MPRVWNLSRNHIMIFILLIGIAHKPRILDVDMLKMLETLPNTEIC